MFLLIVFSKKRKNRKSVLFWNSDNRLSSNPCFYRLSQNIVTKSSTEGDVAFPPDFCWMFQLVTRISRHKCQKCQGETLWTAESGFLTLLSQEKIFMYFADFFAENKVFADLTCSPHSTLSTCCLSALSDENVRPLPEALWWQETCRSGVGFSACCNCSRWVFSFTVMW